MAKQHMTHSCNETCVKLPELEVGSKVWLDTKDLRLKVPARKLAPKHLGPFQVLEQIENLDYQLDLPANLLLHNVFHVDRLSACVENEAYSLHPQPAPVDIKGKLEYEVDHILDSKIDRRVHGGLHYLAHWKGYGCSGSYRCH